MDFTRGPIIETVITPKDGFKLVIRNSRESNREEYLVNAVEVVSFGSSYFFRCLEKPKAFLLPLGEYEVLETKETRSVLKKPHAAEKSIKIGGKDSGIKMSKNAIDDKKSPRKKVRRRKPSEIAPPEVVEKTDKEGTDKGGEEKVSLPPPVRRTLLPPPTSLISEEISRNKDFLQEKVETPPTEDKKIEEFPADKAPSSEETPKEEAHTAPQDGEES